ncbi:MAG: serine/threonine protein kinase [Deltaproteobacteria bacterium]|nr:serine/threonine protein kinase [Deltaproteobacteria bacterium]MBP7291202.1 serine/threonine protein kinase [Nannocystaceae bacterium]
MPITPAADDSVWSWPRDAAEVPTVVPAPGTEVDTEGGGLEASTRRFEPARDGLLPGTIIDAQYRIDGIIGAGAMGVVYRAHHLRLDRPVALKLQRTAGEDTARLEREARAMARLSHPNVVGVYDVGTVGGDVYIAMEYIDGCSLRAWLREHPRSWRAALDVCMQAARGLMAAHAAGIVHRDFKPDNVLVGRDARVRVADFGIARGFASPFGADGASPPSLGPDLTRTGSMAGTPAYMAPEQFAGEADQRSDVFALCVVLWESMLGRRPFGGATLAELMANVTQGRIREVGRTEVPPAVVAVLREGLAVAPQRRTSSVANLLAALERAASQGRSTGAIAAAVIGAVVLVLGLLGLAWWSARTTNAPQAPTPAVTVLRIGGEGSDDDDDEPVVSPAMPRPVAQLERTPVVAPPEDDEPAPRVPSEAEGLHAIAELAAGRPADPDALLAAAEVDADRMLAATAAGLMAKDAEAHVDAGNFVRPAWDGRSQLICGFGDKFLLQGETLSLDGTAFLAMYGCQLHLVDCDITADTIVQVMMRAEVTITGGTMRPRDTFVRQLRGSLVVAGVEVASRPRVGIDVLGGTAHVADLTVSADTGVRAGADAKVELVGGRIEGATQAIESGGTAVVSHDGTRVIGPITIGRGSSVAAVSAPVATAPPVPR